MKKLILAGLTSLVILSGVALAQQSGEPKGDSSMRGMMQEMMGGESGMGGMMGMMGQMDKMMDQCISVHESMRAPAGEQKEEQKK